MKIIYSKVFPPKNFTAINIWGLLIIRHEHKKILDQHPIEKDRLINHESIHTRQMQEMLFVFFYLWYSLEWILRLIQYRNADKAYRNISFEREAYQNQDNLDYLKQRKRFSWLR